MTNSVRPFSVLPQTAGIVDRGTVYGGPSRRSVGVGLALVALTTLLALLLAGWLQGGTSTPASAGTRSLPLAARGPISRLIGARDSAFSIKALQARNPAQRFALRFGAGGVAVRAGGAHLKMTLDSFGRADSMASVKPAAASVARNEVDYADGALTQSYANGPLGLEQSFRLASRPSGSGPLLFDVALSGNLAVRQAGEGLRLTGDGQQLAYRDLLVTDATGRRLPARLKLTGGGFAIQVDDRDAVYPLHVDPLVQEAVLRLAGEEDGGFGGAIAVEGKVIAVADEYTEEQAGRVYVFEEPAAGWSESTEPVKTLQGPGKEEGFGQSIALSGRTLVVGAPGRGYSEHDVRGAAIVFEAPSPTEWAKAKQVAELKGPDEYILLGEAVGISGKTIVAGASGHDGNLGALYAYEKPAGGWESTNKYGAELHGPNVSESKLGELCLLLGSTLAVTEHEGRITVVGGAPGAYDEAGGQCTRPTAGQVDVFTANSGEWDKGSSYQPTATYEVAAGSTGNYFGWSIGLTEDGSEFVAAAPLETVAGAKEAGAAYVYTRPVSGWGSATPGVATLTSAKPFEKENFGWGAAINASGSKVVANDASRSSTFHEADHAFLYGRPAGGWASTSSPSEELTANFEEDISFDGHAIAFNGEQVLADVNRAVAIYGSGAGVEIVSPANGATYTKGQVVTAEFRCVPPTGATITSCKGTVEPGQPVDTSTEGIHYFTINGAYKEEGAAEKTFLGESVYLVTAPAVTSKTSTEAVSKEGGLTTKTKALVEAEEAAHKAALETEMKEFAVYWLYILEHPAPLGRCFNENGFQENGSVVPVSAWISAHGVANGASSAGASSASVAKAKKPKLVTVFSTTVHVNPGKVSIKIHFTKAGRALAKSLLAKHRALQVKWTLTIRPNGLPTITKHLTATFKPAKRKKK